MALSSPALTAPQTGIGAGICAKGAEAISRQAQISGHCCLEKIGQFRAYRIVYPSASKAYINNYF